MQRVSSRNPTAVLGLVVAIVGWIFLVATGVDVLHSLILVLVLVSQGWAGAYLWRLGRREEISALEEIGAGLALGTVFAVVCGLVVTTFTHVAYGCLLPAGVALVVWVIRRSRGHRLAPGPVLQSSLRWGALAAIGLGVISLIPNLRSYPLTWTGTWSGYHGDMLFFESLSTSMARLGPLNSIFSPDALVRYHWLTYAWSGQVTATTSTASFIVLTRVLPFVAVIGSCLVAASWAARLTRVAWVPTFAVVLLVTGGYLGASYGSIFNFDSPSQSLSVLWLLGLVVALLEFVRRPSCTLGAFVALLACGVTGGKVSAGVVVVAASIWLAFVGVVMRKTWGRQALVACLVTSGAAAAGYLLVIAGSADPGGLHLFSVLDRASSVQGLNPVAGPVGVALGTLILIAAIGARWVGVLWLMRDPLHRAQPYVVISVGFMLAGAGTVIVLSGGLNDMWFALAASAPLAVVSAVGAGSAWEVFAGRGKSVLAMCAGAAVLLTIAAFALWSTGASGGNAFSSTLRWAAPVVAIGGAFIAAAFIGRRPGGRRAFWAACVLVLLFTVALARFLSLSPRSAGEAAPMADYAFTPVRSFTMAIDKDRVTGWSDHQVAAADLIRSKSPIDAVVATNVTFSPLVPALTGRQTWVSGIGYQAPYGRPAGIPVLLERERQSHEFIDTPTGDGARALCSSGIRWLWVDPSRTETRSWTPFADIVMQAGDVIVLRMTAGTCG